MILLGSAIIALMTFFLVLLLVVYARYVQRRDVFFRLGKYDISQGNRTSEKTQKTFTEKIRYFFTRLASPFANFASMHTWDIKMRQAGIPLLGGEFFVVVFCSAILIGVGTWMLTLDMASAILIGTFTIIFIWLIVSLRISKRKQIFIAQLGDALTTISNALRAGYSFQQSMDAVAREMEPPISEEFSQVAQEIAMGVPLEMSLEAMNKRMDSSDFDLVVTAVIIQREVGGNLAQILDTISETIVERIRLKREMYTLTAQGRMSAKVIFLLPFIIGTFLYFVNPSQIMMLFEDPVGRFALIGSFLLELVGIVVIQRILDVKI